MELQPVARCRERHLHPPRSVFGLSHVPLAMALAALAVSAGRGLEPKPMEASDVTSRGLESAVLARDLVAVETILQSVDLLLVEDPTSAELAPADAHTAARALFGLPPDATAAEIPEQVAWCGGGGMSGWTGGAALAGRHRRVDSHWHSLGGVQSVHYWVATVSPSEGVAPCVVAAYAPREKRATTGYTGVLCANQADAPGRAIGYFTADDAGMLRGARQRAIPVIGDTEDGPPAGEGATAAARPREAPDHMPEAVLSALEESPPECDPVRLWASDDLVVLYQTRRTTFGASSAVSDHVLMLFRDGNGWTEPLFAVRARVLGDRPAL